MKDQIFLDPNNIRLVGFRGKVTRENRITEEGVQQSLVDLLKRRFDVDSIKNSIIREGYLPVDKVVVRKLGENEKYIVIEGNRRIAAIKSILQEYESGEFEDERRYAELQEIEVLQLVNPTQEDIFLIQGIRHIPGIMEWGAFQKGEAIAYLREQGREAAEVSQTLGGIIRPSEVTRYERAYYATRQMMEDDEYGRHSSTDYFTYFDELLKPKFQKIREWLGWNESQRKFTNTENLKTFYSWITGDGDRNKTQIGSVRELRGLPDVFDSERARKGLFDGQTVEQAKTLIVRPPPDWRERLQELEAFLRAEIPLAEEFTDEDIGLIGRIRALVSSLASRIGRLRRAKKRTGR